MASGSRNRVLHRQLEILWEFLNSNREIAVAYNRSLQAKEQSKRKWREIADILNSDGGGCHKDWTGWSKYWVDYKGKLKKRMAMVRSSHARTGGGPSTERPLTDIENKFIRILGEDFGQGMPGVRVELPPEIMGLGVNVQDTASVLENDSSIPDSVHSEIPFLEPPDLYQDQQVNTPPNPPHPTPHPAPLPHTPHPAPPPHTPHPAPPSPTPHAAPAHITPRRRRRRRQPPISQEAARRALMQYSQMQAEASVRHVEASERQAEACMRMAEAVGQAVEQLTALNHTASRIEMRLNVGYSTSAAPESSD